MTPKTVTIFLNPRLFLKAFIQTTKTKALTQICKQPASKLLPSKSTVKFAIIKNANPAAPERAIQHFSVFIYALPLNSFVRIRNVSISFSSNSCKILTKLPLAKGYLFTPGKFESHTPYCFLIYCFGISFTET